tara:strand:- start:205 stop:951 length:747 start_codon:yes stop_codon:yes gene_type:complete
MIFDWFTKKKEIKIEWWSTVDGLNDPSLDFLRPQKASKFFPAWFKRTMAEMSSGTISTIKKCPVFGEFLTQGYVVPLWTDIELFYDTDKNGEEYWEYKTPSDHFTWDVHNREQFLDHIPESERKKWGFTWKAICPWRVRTPKGYSMYQMPLWYHFSEFQVLPGSIRTDFHYEINQQILAPLSWKGQRIRLQRGTPLAWYIPYRRESYSHEFVPYTGERQRITESSRMISNTKFTNGYKEQVKREDRKL